VGGKQGIHTRRRKKKEEERRKKRKTGKKPGRQAYVACDRPSLLVVPFIPYHQ
jgi:hypothetical protein